MIKDIYIYVYIGCCGASPFGKSFRFVCACGLVAQWDSISKEVADHFPFLCRPALIYLSTPDLPSHFSWAYAYIYIYIHTRFAYGT